MSRAFRYQIPALFLACAIQAAAKPNVIMVLVDDLGYGDLYSLYQHQRDDGAGGGTAGDGLINGSEKPFIHTPHLDRMAAEGATLSQHYTSAPVCAPARGSLLQGRDQGHSNIRNNSFDKAVADNHTLGTVLQAAGYHTSVVGKWGIGGGTGPDGKAHPNLRGFDYFYGMMGHTHAHEHYPSNGGSVIEQKKKITSGLENAYSTDLWVAKAKDIIIDRTRNHAEQPFFIYLAITAPHARLQVPTQAYPENLGLKGGLSWPLNTREGGKKDSYIHPDYKKLKPAAARHATMVRRIDTGMGDILQTLRDLGIADNTLVAFTSDNGTHNEAGHGGKITYDPRLFDSYAGFEGIKRDVFEGGLRVPTFAWWPGGIGNNDAKSPGRDVPRPSAFWDWMPTFAEAAELTPPAWSNGVSLLPELTGKGSQLDKGYLYFEYRTADYAKKTPNYAQFPNHGGNFRGEAQVILMPGKDGKVYKGVRTGTKKHSDPFEIYDLSSDPAESKDLTSSMPDLQQSMKDKVLQVRMDGDYKRGYMAEAFAPGVQVSTQPGLSCSLFEGDWPWIPETDYLSASKTAVFKEFSLPSRPKGKGVLEFTGFITVPSEGEYTFHMKSNTQSMLWIHEANLIADDFKSKGKAKGSMRLQAGKHPIRVIYKYGEGTPRFGLEYEGPNLKRQDVKASMLSHSPS